MKQKVLSLTFSFLAFYGVLYSQTGTINDFSHDEYYNYYKANSTGTFEERNLSFINRIFKLNLTNLPKKFKSFGSINVDYLETGSAYNVSVTCMNGSCSKGSCIHTGIDYNTRDEENGIPIHKRNLYSLISGEVVNNGQGSFGAISIYNAKANITLVYLHCSESRIILNPNKEIPTFVKAGQLIGISGNKGGGVGPHLHVELHKGKYVGQGVCPKFTADENKTYDPRIIDDIIPVPITLLNPRNDNSAWNLNIDAIKFSWDKFYLSNHYTIEIAKSSTFRESDILIRRNINNTFFLWTGAELNTQYFWRVKGSHKNNFDNEDEIREFRTRPQPPTIVFPSSGNPQVNACSEVTLSWEMPTNTVNNNAEYRVQISEDPMLRLSQQDIAENDPRLVFDSKKYISPLSENHIRVGGQKPSNFRITCPNLKPNTQYHMRIRISNAKGISLWASRSFKTGECGTTVQYSTFHYSVNSEPFREIPISIENTIQTQNADPTISGDNYTMAITDDDLEIPVSEIKPGLNTLLYYFQDATGKRSAVNAKTFFNTGTKNEFFGNADRQVEYWFGNDFNARKTIQFGTSSENELDFNTDGLDFGPHTVHWRARAGRDTWSSVNTSNFTKSTRQDGITQVEYWFNEDFDNRKQKQIEELTDVDSEIDASSLALGNHTLFYRFQYAGGKWSAINRHNLSKNTGSPRTSGQGYQMQYWFNDVIGAPYFRSFQDLTSNEFPLSVGHLDTGYHMLYARFRQIGGMWSSVTSKEFYKIDSVNTICPVIPSNDLEIAKATQLFCDKGILRNNPGDCVSFPEGLFKRKDLAVMTMRALINDIGNFPMVKNFPTLFGDLQVENSENACYFGAAKLLSYLDYGDGIPPFNPSRLNFNGNDTIVRGYALKVLMEAWDIKPDTHLPNPFNDLVPGAEVNGYILKAAQLGIIKRPDTHGEAFASFRPFRAITRDETFLMLYRILMVSSRPEVSLSDMYMPFNRTNLAGTNPALEDGNFSSYFETPFSLKGVPDLDLNFHYNSSLLELPESATKGRLWDGRLAYDKEPLGKGWTHNFNAYIVVDLGIDDINAIDDRWMFYWPEGHIQVYQPQQNKFLSAGVYDKVSYSGGFGSIPTTITLTKKNQIKYKFSQLTGSSTSDILHLVEIEDRHGNKITLEYEDGFSANPGINIKRLKKVSDPHGRFFDFEYAENTNYIEKVNSVAAEINRQIRFEYTQDKLRRYINSMDDGTTYHYGKASLTENLIFRIELPRGNSITNTYSANRKLQSSAFTGGSKTTVNTRPDFTTPSIAMQSETTTIVDGKIIKKSYLLNNIGMPILISGPLQNDSIAYADSRHPTRPTYKEDRIKETVSIYEYDENGNTTKSRIESLGSALETSYLYNERNDIVSRTDARGKTTNYLYNQKGQLIEVRAPIGATKYIVNVNGTILREENPSGIVTSYQYDTYGNETSMLMPEQIQTNKEWDAAGRLIGEWDANGVKSEFLYDANDNLMKEVRDPTGLNVTTLYRYDKNDNLIEVENANGGITYLIYNQEDQLIAQRFGTDTKTFEYHEDGSYKSIVTPNKARLNYRYNARGRLINDGYATYDYYEDGTLSRIAKSGNTLSYRYDVFNRVTQTSYSDFPGNTVGYEYDQNSNITSIRYPTGFSVRYQYDDNNRLIRVNDNAGQAYVSYQYLSDGRLSMSSNKNGTSTKYFYDEAGRLDSMLTTRQNGEVITAYRFEMDKNGNHIKENSVQPLSQMIPQLSRTENYEYSNTNRLMKRNEERFEYDNNGNLISQTIPGNDGRKYLYDTKDNLVRYEGDGEVFFYEYDGLEQRRRRNDVRYVLDNKNNVLMETDLQGNPLYFYIHGIGLVTRIKANSLEESYYHYDYRGSTVAITNSQQEITHEYNYDAFGTLQQAVEDDFNAYRYVGKYGVAYESSDLMFMRARYYQPSIGRFISEDPIWAVNLYPYVDNNPIAFIDYNGKLGVRADKVTGLLKYVVTIGWHSKEKVDQLKSAINLTNSILQSKSRTDLIDVYVNWIDFVDVTVGGYVTPGLLKYFKSNTLIGHLKNIARTLEIAENLGGKGLTQMEESYALDEVFNLTK